MEAVRNYFEIQAKGSSIRTELLAGFATFLTMAYIAVVNPSILSQAKMDFGAVFVATILAAAVGTDHGAVGQMAGRDGAGDGA